MTLFIVLFLVHCLDDFFVQPVCLSKLKQRKFWLKYPDVYRHDYVMALLIHAFEWSAALSVALLLFGASETFAAVAFVVNGVVHAVVDNAKANKLSINLIVDQSIHIVQLVATTILYHFV